MSSPTLRLFFALCSFSIAGLTAHAETMPASAKAPSVTEFAARAEKHEPLTVVFLGGSLTWGANASDSQVTSYRGRLMTYLLKKYPNTPFTFHDAAIGGSGSQLALHRLERDVFPHNPDLVILEFTVNDDASGTDVQHLASYERIVRELLAHNTAVMPVLTLFKWHAEKPDEPRPARHEDHLKLAQAYGLPAANVLDYVRAKVKAGAKIADMWEFDGAHPGDYGYQLFFEAVRNRFEAAITETIPTVIPTETVFDNLYPKHTRKILLDDPLPEGWVRNKTYRTALWFDGLSSRWMGDVATASAKNKSAALEIEFEGSQVGYFGEHNGLSPKLKIWIDGEPVQAPKAKEGDYLWPTDTSRFAPPSKGSGNLFMWQLISNKLADGKHTLRIEPIWEDAHKDAEFRIESICSAGR